MNIKQAWDVLWNGLPGAERETVEVEKTKEIPVYAGGLLTFYQFYRKTGRTKKRFNPYADSPGYLIGIDDRYWREQRKKWEREHGAVEEDVMESVVSLTCEQAHSQSKGGVVSRPGFMAEGKCYVFTGIEEVTLADKPRQRVVDITEQGAD